MYSLLPYNTFGIDVSAARFLEYSSVEELKKLIVQGAIVTPFLLSPNCFRHLLLV